MDSDIVGSILLQVVLIAVNAVFACAEIAVVSCNDAKLEKMAQEGNKRAAKLFHLTEQPSRFLATIQVVITLSGFLGSAFAAENFSDRIVSALVDAGMKIPEKTLDAYSEDYHLGLWVTGKRVSNSWAHADENSSVYLWRTGSEKYCNAEG